MVTICEANDCAYNRDSQCHAKAITIGDGVNPKCDTFCMAARKGGDAATMAGVGACKVSICAYNSNLECLAPKITVGYSEQEPDCLTFEPR